MTLRNANRWVMVSATGIVLLAVGLLLVPNSRIGPNAQLTGWVLLAAGALEMACSIARRRRAVRRIEILLGAIAVGAALLILLWPGAYPLLFVAITCLLVRAAGAVVAAFLSSGEVRVWVLGRALVDLLLGGILLAGAPLAAIVSIISGNRWPDRSGAVLTNFVAISMLATGLAMLGLALRARRGDIDSDDEG
ncbi:MAG: hypothetical protein QOI38_117 [Sphingomonadales bacterium]|jgi:uncharacterized membrane protein HdeD (DUF308 family)|nr:hypothetical protein [Sphingomonadales bacterium]